MHKLCYRNVGERTYYSKLKWDVLLSILTLCEGSQLPWWLGFEGLLPELCKNKPTSLNFAWLETQFFLQNAWKAKPIHY
jgi:hypothetical protein